MSTQERNQETNKQPPGAPIYSSDSIPLLTVDDVAYFLRLEPDTVRALARDGKLPAIKLGRVWRFKQDEINLWIQQSHT